MRRPSLAFGALLGGLLAVPLMALFYLGERGAGLPFVPFDLFDWLARVLPGGLITLGIDTMVGAIGRLGLGPTSAVAKAVEQSLGIVLVAGLAAALGGLVAWLLRRVAWAGWRLGLAVGAAAFVLVVAVELSMGLDGPVALALLWLAALIPGWGALAGHLLDVPPLPAPEATAGRRAFLIRAAGASIAVAAAAWGLGRLLVGRQRGSGAGRPVAEVSPLMAPAPEPTPAGRIEAVPGTRAELTPLDEFYRIDINTVPPHVDGETWMLEVKGLFDRPRPLTLAGLAAFQAVTQPLTLSCISNPVGGDLISTGYWTGVRLGEVLADLGLRPEARAVVVRSADGFYESVLVEDIADPRTLLVYAMDGQTLTASHGYPLRVYIPNRYGMKQPKWVISIEAVAEPVPGYWVERGWSAEARPQIVSVIDTVNADYAVDGRVPVGGIAWAGDRGIRKVEVQVDGGEWIEAALRMPTLSPLTWVQWRYDWPAARGAHTLRVRATDGAGTLQTEEVDDPHPNGATGYHSFEVTI